jgi:hypothetical protein
MLLSKDPLYVTAEVRRHLLHREARQLAMLGIFGGNDRKRDAKEVLRILLGREGISNNAYGSVNSQSARHK